MPEEPDLAPAQLDPDYFQQVADRWRLELLELPEVSRWATVALTHGHDGPALRELAWSHDSWGEVGPLMPQAVAEVGLPVPSRGAALARLLRPYARAVLAEEVPLYEGLMALNSFVFPLRWGLDAAEWPAGFDPVWLDHVLDEWNYDVAGVAQARIEADLRAMLAALVADAPAPGGDAPALGGRRAAPEPEPPPTEAGGGARFSFEIAFTMDRIFSWSWPPRGGA